MNNLFIKKLSIDDADQLFYLRNQDDIVKKGYSQKKVDYNDHLLWLKKALIDQNKFMFLSFINNLLAGFISFEKIYLSEKFVISIFLDKNFRNQGIGKQIYIKAYNILPFKPKIVLAKVRKDNYISKLFFEKLGFVVQVDEKDLFFMEKNYDVVD